MNDIELQNIWQSYDRKIEEARILNLQSWALNLHCFETIQRQKAAAKLNGLVTIKAVVAFLGILWVAFLGFLIYHSLSLSKIFFVVSAGMIMLVTLVAIIVYIQHIVWIKQISNSETIVDTQEKLARLQTSTMWITRILFLQLPFHTTWFLNMDMLMHAGTGLLIFQLAITALFAFLAVWLYKNISYKNTDKKWFRILFSSKEWTSVIKAIGFIEEIEDFKNDRLAS